MTFKLKNILLFFLIMLPFGNFPQLFNLGEDTGSIYISLIIGILVLIWFVNERKIFIPKYIKNRILLYFLLLGFLLDIVSIAIGTVSFEIGLSSSLNFTLSKLVLIYVIIVIAERLNIFESIDLLTYFTIILMLSLIISLIVYPLNPIPEFVIYDGGTRFGGFHFELVNFTFSVLVGFFVYSFHRGFSIYKFFIALVLIYFLSKSNGFYPFVLAALFAILIARIRNKFLLKGLVASIILITPIIGIFLDYFSFLEVFSVRASTDFTIEGSSLFVRLYPWALAMNHFLETFLYFPIGLGMLEASPYILEVENLYGGTGITKVIAEFGFISILFIPFIYFYFVNIFKNIFNIEDTNSRLCFSAILILVLTYICMQSGFFNLTAWCLCIMIQNISIRYISGNK